MKRKIKVLSAIMLFLVILPLSQAKVPPKEAPHENLDWWSEVETTMKDLSFTITGQERGCDVEPSKSQFLNAEDMDGNFERWTFSYAGENKPGLANIYTINDDGSYNYIEEKTYEYMWSKGYNFDSDFDYAIEFYDCEGQKDREPYTTPDGYKDGDVICRKGDYLAEVVFEDKYSYDYVRTSDCENGCTSSVCRDPSTEEEDLPATEEYVGASGESGDKRDEFDQGEADKDYQKLIDQLENKKVKIKELNDLLDKKGSINDSKYENLNKTQLLGMISGLNKDIENLKEKKSTNWTIPTIIIVGGVLLVVFRKNIVAVVRRVIP